MTTFMTTPRTPEAMFFDRAAAIDVARQRLLLSPHLSTLARDAYATPRAYFDMPHGRLTTLDRLVYTDLKTSFSGQLTTHARMSTAASIETGAPFLDHALVEFAAQLPARMKVRGRITTWVLRQAVKPLLPASALARRADDFPVPFGSWFRGGGADLAREVLLDGRARQRGLTDGVAVAGLIDAHASGALDAGDALWGLMNLELWYRTFIDGDGVQTLPAPAC